MFNVSALPVHACPHCGSSRIIWKQKGRHRKWVYVCFECASKSLPARTLDAAKFNWDMRAKKLNGSHCPHCEGTGQNVYKRERPNQTHYRIKCFCGHKGPKAKTVPEAHQKWLERSPAVEIQISSGVPAKINQIK